MKPRLPAKIPLLPGLRWKGTLRVNKVNAIDGVAVVFDAVVVGMKEGEDRFVFDHAILTDAQFKAWTGVDAATLRVK